MEPFIEFLESAKNDIETAACGFFDDYGKNIVDSALVKSALCDLRSHNGGGKRIRGALIKLGEMIASHGANGDYLPIAVGYELFQTSVLIHDDIIDKGETRRGKNTIHVESANSVIDRIKNNDIISGAAADTAANHYGISRAICIGDYGFFISYQFLTACGIDSSALVKVINLYSKILAITCEGEIMDSLLPMNKISIVDNYKEYVYTVTKIYEYKSAWYTLAGPLMLGAVCGEANESLIEVLKEIAVPLGIAFQIKDDLLGVYSSKDVLGKSILSDVRENKQTLMYGYAYKFADKRQRESLDAHYGREGADENDLDIVRSIFEKTGAKKFAEDEIHRLSKISGSLIADDMIDGEYQLLLKGLIEYLIDRKF